MRSPIRPAVWLRGHMKRSTRGPTITATPKVCSAATKYWTTLRYTGSPIPEPLLPVSTGKITTTTSAPQHKRPIRSKYRWPSRCSPMKSTARRRPGHAGPIRLCTIFMRPPRGGTSPPGNNLRSSVRKFARHLDHCADLFIRPGRQKTD